MKHSKVGPKLPKTDIADIWRSYTLLPFVPGAGFSGSCKDLEGVCYADAESD